MNTFAEWTSNRLDIDLEMSYISSPQKNHISLASYNKQLLKREIKYFLQETKGWNTVPLAATPEKWRRPFIQAAIGRNFGIRTFSTVLHGEGNGKRLFSIDGIDRALDGSYNNGVLYKYRSMYRLL